MSGKRDWKRPFSWSVAALIFGSVTTMTPTVDINNAMDVLAVSFLLGLTCAVAAMAMGACRTALTNKPSKILIPFYSAPRVRSLQAIGLWITGMILKVMSIHLGAIGVISMLVVAFLAVQRLWPDEKLILTDKLN